MTDNEKIREDFETWASGKGLCIAPYGASYADEKTHTAWITWQAAKSEQAVAVVGDVLFFASDSTATSQSQIRYDVCADQKDYSFFPVVRKPTTSITHAELERLRKDAERYRWLRDSPESPIINVGYATDKMVDAAIAGEGEKE